MFKQLVAALKEMVELGGRVTEETRQWFEHVLGDDFDEFQEQAKEFVDSVTTAAKAQLSELEDRLDNLASRVDDMENSVPPKPKGQVKKS